MLLNGMEMLMEMGMGTQIIEVGYIGHVQKLKKVIITFISELK